jgi:hypothetical protein
MPVKRKRKKQAQKKIPVFVAVCLLAGLGVFILFRPEIKTYGGVRPVGAVNGEPFFQEDLEVYALEFRAAVAADYGRKYNLSGVGAKFWDTKYSGGTPREALYKIALDRVVKNMVLIQEARRRGIDVPKSYHDLETEREEWNTPTGEIAYGPKELRSAEFNSYRITGITDDLKTVLLRKELAPTEAQLRAAYESLPGELKQAPWSASGDLFTWDEGPSPEGEIRAALRRGLGPEDAVRESAGGFPGLRREDFELQSNYISKEDPYERELADVLERAVPGSFVPGPRGRPELYHVTGKKGGGALSFEDAPQLGRNKWINDQFEIFLNKKVKAAKVKRYPVPAS